ncbi:MAG: hypothetical protein R2712_01680 [Vicinamibacterales bacterium]
MDQLQESAYDTFGRSARLLADLPRFKAAVDTAIRRQSADRRGVLRQLGADVPARPARIAGAPFSRKPGTTAGASCA